MPQRPLTPAPAAPARAGRARAARGPPLLTATLPRLVHALRPCTHLAVHAFFPPSGLQVSQEEALRLLKVREGGGERTLAVALACGHASLRPGMTSALQPLRPWHSGGPGACFWPACFERWGLGCATPRLHDASARLARNNRTVRFADRPTSHCNSHYLPPLIPTCPRRCPGPPLPQATEKGLTTEEVQRRLAEYGPNKLPEETRNPILVYLSYM